MTSISSSYANGKSVIIINESNSPGSFYYFDDFNNLISIEIKKNEKVSLFFDKELLLYEASAFTKNKYLIHESDTLIYSFARVLKSISNTNNLEVLNIVDKAISSINIFDFRNRDFINFIRIQSYDSIKFFLQNNLRSKDSVINCFKNLDTSEKYLYKNYYKFENILTLISCLFRKMESDTLLIRNEIKNILSDIDTDNSVYSKKFRSAINAVITGYYPSMESNDNIDFLISEIDNLFRGKSKQYALFYLTNILVNKGSSKFISVYEKTKPLIFDDLYKQYLSNIENSFEKSYDFEFLQGTKSFSLNQIIEKSKDKVLVVDVMASWCIPCLESLSITKRIEEKYSNEINFVYMSIDNDINKWLKYIINNELPSSNVYFLRNGINSQFAKRNKISEIPRYIIYDRGNLIDASNISALDGSLEKALKSLFND